MKILELTTYSAGGCGVFARVKEESRRLSNLNHEVKIFSTNHTKGSSDIAPKYEKIGKVEITRFPATKLGGESYTLWDTKNLKKAIIEYHPDVIIAHAYRHTHTIIAYKIAKKIGARSILVTHAPFGDSSQRSFLSKLFIKVFDQTKGKKSLENFDKIIIISQWEKPFLKTLGVPESKIEYIPNGIPEEFFKQKSGKEQNKILYFGRVSPIKDLETLLKAFSEIKDKQIDLEIAGASEEKYLKKLKGLANHLKIIEKVKFTPAIYNIKEKIKKIDSASIYVLPSKREGMPQTLIEAMARGKVVIASNNQGSKDLIADGKNGFLFPIGNHNILAQKIEKALTRNMTRIKKSAKNSVRQFAWPKIIKKLDSTIQI